MPLFGEFWILKNHMGQSRRLRKPAWTQIWIRRVVLPKLILFFFEFHIGLFLHSTPVSPYRSAATITDEVATCWDMTIRQTCERHVQGCTNFYGCTNFFSILSLFNSYAIPVHTAARWAPSFARWQTPHIYILRLVRGARPLESQVMSYGGPVPRKLGYVLPILTTASR